MSKYTELITSYHRGKPLFVDHIDLSTRPLIDISDSLKNLPVAFDLDEAQGVQLDKVGEWIGRTRIVKEPISGIYFSFDDDEIGFDQGVWQGPYDPDEGFTSLSDEVYRTILKIKIAINHWDGLNDSVPAILNEALEGTGIRMAIVDNQDMTISVWVLSEPLTINLDDRLILDSSLNEGAFIPLPENYVSSGYSDLSLNTASRELMAAIRQGYLTIKSAGVNAGEIITPAEGYQFFGFDLENDYIAGFDAGAWEKNL